MWPLEVNEVIEDGDITVKCISVSSRSAKVKVINLIVMQHNLDTEGSRCELIRKADVSLITYHDQIFEVASSEYLSEYIHILSFIAYMYVLSPGQKALLFE